MEKFFALILLGGGYAAGICAGEQQPLGPVDLCSMAAKIQVYKDQQVRLTAFLGAGGEQDVLYDPKCQDGKPLVYVSFQPKALGQVKALRRIVQKKGYALVTLEGTMRGPEPIKVDPNLPVWLKDRFKNSAKRYGHLNSLEMMIEVTRIIQARDVDDGMKSSAAANGRP